jgi:hypothetical protein
MTTQPLAVRYAPSWTLQADTAALRALNARYLAALAMVSRWGRQPRRLATTDDRYRDDHRFSRLSGGSFRQIDYAPGGIFDPLFTGISADAAGLNAAICRKPYLRRKL